MTGKNKKRELRVGDKMPDGTIFAGISPDTDMFMYVTAKDADLTMTFNTAKEYASRLGAHGHQDWRVPSHAELNVLYQNREKGALKGTFDLNAFSGSSWYLSSTNNGWFKGQWLPTNQEPEPLGWRTVGFSQGWQDEKPMDQCASVRCVR